LLSQVTSDFAGETDYAYDSDGQLTGESSLLVSNTFSYDANGNRVGGGYVVGPGNRLLADGTWSYSYDAEGNLVGKTHLMTGDRWTYRYDHRNQMTLAEKRDASGAVVLYAVYKYDVFGNRIEKAVDWDGDGPNAAVVTRYVLDGWNNMKPTPIGNEHFDIHAELDGANQLIARYLHGDEFDQTFARVDLGAANASERVQWYLTDHLNSVRLVLDETGAVLDQIAYDAFGNIVAQLNPLLVNPILFTSREFDAETGLYYNRARYLDPTTGRWTTQDPLGFAAGDANLYRYVGNTPTTFLDPSGLDRIDYRDNGAGQTLVWYVPERWFWRGDGPRQLIGVLTQINGQSYVRRFVDGQAMFVPLHLVQGTTGFWADSVGNWDQWFRQNRQTDFSSTVASGWSQEFGVDLTGTVAELRRTGMDAYRDTYIIGPTVTVGMAVVPAGARIVSAPTTGTVRWAGGVPSEEGLRLVDSARRSLQVPTSRNIAFAESVIEGRGRQLVTGVSGSVSPPGTVASPTSRLFQTRATRGAIPTQWDSEVKILADIARGLPRDARGTINLFTERPPCPSCRGVIDQFREMFPNITVNVTHGGR
jgi:RHS repeat-associated protein